MKVAIIDDEIHCIESLNLDLRSIDPEIRVVYKSNKPTEALEKLPHLDIDLLFLDVEMPHLNGFELLDNLGDVSFAVIFTTAYSQYAVQAFKKQAFSYLLKPIDTVELEEVIDNWKSKYNSNSGAIEGSKIQELLKELKEVDHFKNKIAVPISDGYEFLEVQEIIYCKSENNYTTIYLKGGSKHLISKTLKEVERTLEKYLFIRIHQSYLINPNCLVKYSRNNGGYVKMCNGEELPVSNKKKELITNFFDAVKKQI
ncbi:MAG: LytTR family DNA-binding domain-containing protein [Cyclobacteriaceae bacterium]|nr:response regulator transcription factor [Cyclobacteriaceae bacterium]MCH8515842.1 LytTR family DNA-binding domain-containing protein [Cyclobacteriaceae bacterium]